MRILTSLLLGATAGLGLWLTVGAALGWSLLPARATVNARMDDVRRWVVRSAVGLLAGLLTLLVTGWPVAAVMAAVGALVGPRLLGGGRERRLAVERTEAIAAWAESVRDTMAAAAGLEEAITATAVAPPAPIAPEVQRLVRRLRHQRLVDALVAFGDDVRHPSADLVVAALTIAARMEAADLTGLLSRLAESIRDDATMRVKVETSRARLRTSAKIIVGSVAATLLLLMLLSRDYLDAYDSLLGQLVLLVVAGIFAGGGWLLARMSRIEAPERFRPRREGAVS